MSYLCNPIYHAQKLKIDVCMCACMCACVRAYFLYHATDMMSKTDTFF